MNSSGLTVAMKKFRIEFNFNPRPSAATTLNTIIKIQFFLDVVAPLIFILFDVHPSNIL